MVHYMLWDAALLLHLVQNLVLLLSVRIKESGLFGVIGMCNPCTITQTESFIL